SRPTMSAMRSTMSFAGETVPVLMSENESVQIVVGRVRQKLHELLAPHQPIQDLRRFSQTSGAGAAELLQFLPSNLAVPIETDRSSLGEPRPAVGPLPELGARDLRGGDILHQIEDPRGADPLEPGAQILESHVDVVSHARFRDRASRDPRIEQHL